VMSISPGPTGGFGANHHLRQSLVFLDMPLLQQPEAYLGGAGSMFGDDGQPQERTRAFFERFITKFASWIERTAQVESQDHA
jgi:chromate reductase